MVPDGTLWLKGISMEDSGLAKDFALLVVGVGFGVLPWLLDKVGIEMPRPIYVLVGCLCILAMGWAFATLDLLDKIQLLKNRPVPLSKGIVAAFALAMLALRSATTESGACGQYFYELLTMDSERDLRSRGQGQKIHETMLYPESWAIFVLFEKPTNYADVNVSFSNPGFPQYEVKQTTNRSLLVSVSGSIPAGFLEIYLKP
jgi:hypothetical protein